MSGSTGSVADPGHFDPYRILLFTLIRIQILLFNLIGIGIQLADTVSVPDKEN
jgi:hypothetical protein